MGTIPDPAYVLPLPQGEPGPKDPPTPYQVERLQHLQKVTKTTNLQWQNELKNLGSRWQYYQLVVTQWPTVPSSPKLDAKHANPEPRCGLQGSFATANTTMETFLQGNRLHCEPIITCMGCHGVAREADFIWSIPMNYHGRSREQQIPPWRALALETLQEIVHQAKNQ
jgi:hypothetical protein